MGSRQERKKKRQERKIERLERWEAQLKKKPKNERLSAWFERVIVAEIKKNPQQQAEILEDMGTAVDNIMANAREHAEQNEKHETH